MNQVLMGQLSFIYLPIWVIITDLSFYRENDRADTNQGMIVEFIFSLLRY